MKAITELIVHVFDLIEAEGRVLRDVAAKLGLGLSLTLVAAVLVLVGCLGLLAGTWLGLYGVLGEAWASVITGIISLAIAGGALAGAVRLSK